MLLVFLTIPILMCRRVESPRHLNSVYTLNSLMISEGANQERAPGYYLYFIIVKQLLKKYPFELLINYGDLTSSFTPLLL